MKILQLCSARLLGGGERHLADLANRLVLRGHDVYAALAPSSQLLAELSALPTKNILELSLRNSLDVVSALRLARFVRRHEIEIIHAHVARDYPVAALAAWRAGCAKLVLTRHVLFPLSKIHKLTLRRVASVIAVSQAVADSLRMQGIFNRDKIVIIHNGIDTERFCGKVAEKGRSNNLGRGDHGTKLVGMVGHLAPIKGQEDFIRAAAIVRTHRKDVDFIIAGEDKSPNGKHRQHIEGLISKLGLGEHVRLVGWLDDVRPLLSRLDLFISPSRSEPFGLAIIEAMASGVPVIATMSEGAREIIEADATGRLVPIGDVEALGKAICELLSDPKDREELRAQALRAIHERFSLANMVDATEQVYRRVLTNGRSSSCD